MVKRHWIECVNVDMFVLVNDNDHKVVATLDRREQIDDLGGDDGHLWEWVERKHVYAGLEAAKNAAEKHA